MVYIEECYYVRESIEDSSALSIFAYIMMSTWLHSDRMKLKYLSLLALGAILMSFSLERPYKRSKLVDPLIGTDWVGNTYPGASSPFGMVQLSPDNGLPGWDRIAGYFYPDSTIAGFSHTHLSGTGAGDLYDISFMPVLEPALRAEAPLGVHAKFRHSQEEASAGHYSVLLEPYDIRVTLTATEHIGVQQYRFNRASDSAVVYLDLAKATNWDRTEASGLRWDASRCEIQGYRYSDGWARGQRVYFYTRLSRAPKRIELDSIPLYHPDTKAQQGWGYTAKLHYSVQAGDEIVVETALSGVSQEAARRNYMAERAPSFAAYQAKVASAWERHLGTIRIPQATTLATARTFYTAMYHAMICPTVYSDVDGAYRGPDGKVHRGKGKHYSTFSLWDTYRTAHPMYNIILPRYNRDMVHSLVEFGHQNNGHLPIWNMWASETDMMIGHHSLPVIAAALEAGIYKPKDKEALRRTVLSTLNRKGYRAMEEYRRLGYVPSDVHKESLSLTLEYAYDDWAGARILDYLGYKAEAQSYYQSARNYRNHWDAQTGYLRPRLANGDFKGDFDPFAYTEDVTESNAYQYLWSAQHDPEGLMEMMGGREQFVQRLDKFFADETPSHIELPIFSTGMIGQYAHGNEPGHHVPFLYYYAGQPWRTTELVYDILTRLYTDKPDGICGNEDCGQMSAWYVMSAIGLYPVEASNDYLITSPLFPEVQIAPLGAKPFTIRAKGLSAENKYIKSVCLNGKPYQHKSLDLKTIQRGGLLELEMTAERGVCWYK